MAESCASTAQDIAELKDILAKVNSKRLREMFSDNLKVLREELQLNEQKENELRAQSKTKEKPVSVETKSSLPSGSQPQTKKISSAQKRWKPITSFAWDQDGYGGKKVCIYVTLKGVGSVKERVSCYFLKTKVDLKVEGLDGINYRFLKEPLSKEIVPENCKFRVKKDKVVITLQKAEGEYGPDHWTDLVEKKKFNTAAPKKDDPTAGIMDLMKQMYDDGDDDMKRTIGEAMLKSRQGKSMDPNDSMSSIP